MVQWRLEYWEARKHDFNCKLCPRGNVGFDFLHVLIQRISCALYRFGDTVNTASRLQASGRANLIHASQATANLIISEGKENWVKSRTEKVTMKGKGDWQVRSDNLVVVPYSTVHICSHCDNLMGRSSDLLDSATNDRFAFFVRFRICFQWWRFGKRKRRQFNSGRRSRTNQWGWTQS